MRVAFLGNDPRSVPSLEALAADPATEVAAVITNPPRPAGRGSRPRPTAVAEAARRIGLNPVEAEGVRAGAGNRALHACDPDALVVVAYGHLLPPEVVRIAPRGAVNVHFSLLPRWRGAAPVERAILAGDAETGVTVMLIDEGIDTGPILAQTPIAIGAREDAGELGDRLAVLGARLLVETLGSIETGTIRARPQDPAGATRAPRLGPQERWIDWAESPEAIDRRVRALAPRPGARTRFRSGELLVLRVEPETGGSTRSAPGSLEVDRSGVLVHAPGGRVRLIELAPAGRAHMSAEAWARGARIRSGERLG
jgi:methionyl-tRNA formyltransferase